MANRGEKHFRNGGNNKSTRKYSHVLVFISGTGTETDRKEVSCRPARAMRALRKARTANHLPVRLMKVYKNGGEELARLN